MQKFLADRARAEGTNVRRVVVVEDINEDADGVEVSFSDGTSGNYDVVIGAEYIADWFAETLGGHTS